jgi:hypothetical protein
MRNRLKNLFLFAALICLGLFLVLMGISQSHSRPQGTYSARSHTAFAIGLALYSYANDHDGRYPQGKSSTEIFQQLVDQGYVSDPAIFYFPMTGKSKATSKTLESINVCWDATDAVQGDDSDALPLIFSTGFKIDYIPGGEAHLLSNGDPNGIAVSYKNHSSRFYLVKAGNTSLIDPTFDPKGRTYRQKTPDGPLP